MADYQPTEEHLRHCMLYHYHSGVNATVATRTICEVYGDVLKVNKCQRWYRKFSIGDFDLADGGRSGRPVEFDIDALKSLLETDSSLSIEEMSKILQAPWSTVHRHLQAIQNQRLMEMKKEEDSFQEESRRSALHKTKS